MRSPGAGERNLLPPFFWCYPYIAMEDFTHHAKPGGAPAVRHHLESQCTQHLHHTSGCCVFLVDPAGSFVLYTFQSVPVLHKIWILGNWGVFNQRPYKCDEGSEVCFNGLEELLRFLLRKLKREFVFLAQV